MGEIRFRWSPHPHKCDPGRRPGNQLTSQISGSFEAVTNAVNHCMKKVMETPNTVVLVVKYLNIEKELGRAPTLTPET